MFSEVYEFLSCEIRQIRPFVYPPDPGASLAIQKETSSIDSNHRPTCKLLSSVVKPSLKGYQLIPQEKINVNETQVRTTLSAS
jgi:hypothetical protein